VGGLVRIHESEERFGLAGFSLANQDAAFDITTERKKCALSRSRELLG
jgi:hypothetical protein